MGRKLSTGLLIIVALVLAACGGAAGGGGGAPTLDQTYNSDGLSFKYPSGWVTEGEGGVVLLASSQAAIDKATSSADVPTLDAGQMAVTIIPFAADIAEMMEVASPLELLQQMTEQTASEDQSFQAPTEATIGGKPAARANGSSGTMEAHFVAVNLGEGSGFVMLGGVGPKGDLSKIEATVNAIAETVAVTPVSE